MKEPGPDGIWATVDDVPALRTGHDDNRTVKGTYQMTSKYKLIGFYALHDEHFDPYPGQVTRLNPHHTTLTFDWNPHQFKGEIQGAPSSRFLFNLLVGPAALRRQLQRPARGAREPRRSDNFTGLVLGANHAQDQRPRESWGPSGSASFFPTGSLARASRVEGRLPPDVSGLCDGAAGRPERQLRSHLQQRRAARSCRTYNYPLLPENRLNEGGAFVQDTWRVGERTTLNLGLRWDSFHSWVPAQTKAQGQFGNAGILSGGRRHPLA